MSIVVGCHFLLLTMRHESSSCSWSTISPCPPTTILVVDPGHPCWLGSSTLTPVNKPLPRSDHGSRELSIMGARFRDSRYCLGGVFVLVFEFLVGDQLASRHSDPQCISCLSRNSLVTEMRQKRWGDAFVSNPDIFWPWTFRLGVFVVLGVSKSRSWFFLTYFAKSFDFAVCLMYL